jgi:hypothetical protein
VGRCCCPAVTDTGIQDEARVKRRNTAPANFGSARSRLGGKLVAVFGLGDSFSYRDSFCEAVFGHGDSVSYGVSSEDSTSKSDHHGNFLDLPLDQDMRMLPG